MRDKSNEVQALKYCIGVRGPGQDPRGRQGNIFKTIYQYSRCGITVIEIVSRPVEQTCILQQQLGVWG